MLQTIACHVVTMGIVLALFPAIPNLLFDICLKVFAFVSVFCLCYLLGTILDRFLPRKSVSVGNKAVFITGCDTGFGHFLAKRLDSKGYKVFAGCLFPSSSDAQNLLSSSSNRLRLVEVDVTKDESVQQALKLVKEELGTSELWALVNNAGIILRGELEWTPLEDQMRQFDVNTFGVVRVTQAFLPLLRRSKGRVVTTTSAGGRFTLSGFAPYCMTKHATNSFCNGLRQEMKKWGIKVITVEPFSYTTAMTDTDVILRSSDSTWSKISSSLKEEYGPLYIEEFKKAITRFNDSTLIEGNKQVIDCLEKAVTSHSPQYCYVPGDVKSHLGFWLLQLVPETIASYGRSAFVTFDNDCMRYVQGRNQTQSDDGNKKMS